MKTFHIDEPREIGKRKDRLSSKEMMMVKKDLSERVGITPKQAKVIKDNLCVFCGVPTNEDLRKWFGKGGAGGTTSGGWDRYSSTGKKLGKCGDSKEGSAYAACLSATKARKLGKKGIASFVKRKRTAQKKGGDPKKGGERSKGQKTIKVKTGA